jgi:two-component system chemotaxis response regulator CheB
MSTRDIIVLGASMGGVEALKQLVRRLSPQLPASLFITHHIARHYESRLADILSRAGPLPAHSARDDEPFQPGHIYIAPADRHLVLEPGRLRLTHGPRENLFRPAIDPLFRSAARHYGPRVAAVLLTGGMGDGAAGLLAVRNAGGVAIVQDPDEAFNAGMPRHALEVDGADHVLPLAEIAPMLERLARQSAPPLETTAVTDPLNHMSEVVNQDMAAQAQNERLATPSVYSCPECGGVLWQVDQQELVRFRCHVGHVYHAESLLADQAAVLEAALWTAVRGFRERATLSRQLSEGERRKGKEEAADRYSDQAELAERQGDSILKHLLDPETGVFPPSPVKEEAPQPDGIR